MEKRSGPDGRAPARRVPWRRTAWVWLATSASLLTLAALPAPSAGAAGLVPPNNPPANITPAIAMSCNDAINDTSAACTNSVLYDIDVGRIDEGLGPLILPANYTALNLAQQNLAIVNLERTARGLPAEYGLKTCMDQDAQTGSNTNSDPVPTNCSPPLNGYGSNWASTTTALESDFLLMYDDGLNSPNIDCTPSDQAGCWGHRDNILNTNLCAPAVANCYPVMGASSSGPTAQEFSRYVGVGGPPNADMAFLNSSITYLTKASPQILSLSATSGSTGVSISVNGIYLSGATTVEFGSSACTATPTVVSDVMVNVSVPLCAFGLTSLDVVTPSGTSNTTPFTGEHAAPYSPISPVRVCDTRVGNPSSLMSAPANQCNGRTLASGGTQNVTVAGAFAIPANATAVVLNVTVVNPSAGGFVTVYPAGAARPTASNLNYTPGAVIPNLVQVGVGTSGAVTFYAQSRTDLVVDVEGYVSPTAIDGSGSGLYEPLAAPARICDTRADNPSNLVAPDTQCAPAGQLPANSSMNVAVTGLNAIPAGAIAAVLNVTAVPSPGATGHLTVYPEGSQRPTTVSNVNYSAGMVASNRVIVPLSADGGISVFSSAGSDVIIDVSGYFSAGGAVSGSMFNPESSPIRICDSRAASGSSPANECSGRTIAAAGILTVPVVGSPTGAVPHGAKAVVINLTAVAPTASTYLSVYPVSRPQASDLNPAAGQVKPNLVVATLSPNGAITVYNNTGSVNIIVDVLGWYS